EHVVGLLETHHAVLDDAQDGLGLRVAGDPFAHAVSELGNRQAAAVRALEEDQQRLALLWGEMTAVDQSTEVVRQRCVRGGRKANSGDESRHGKDGAEHPIVSRPYLYM